MDLVAIIVVGEPKSALWTRIPRETWRTGLLGLFDVFAFRLYYRFELTRTDKAWMRAKLDELAQRYDHIPTSTQVSETSDPKLLEA